jgi:hypothetical protein
MPNLLAGSNQLAIKMDDKILIEAVRKAAHAKGYNEARRDERVFLRQIRTLINTDDEALATRLINERVRAIKEEQRPGLSIKQLRENEGRDCGGISRNKPTSDQNGV